MPGQEPHRASVPLLIHRTCWIGHVCSAGLNLGREELERGTCRALLLASEIDPVLAGLDGSLGRDLFRRQADAQRSVSPEPLPRRPPRDAREPHRPPHLRATPGVRDPRRTAHGLRADRRPARPRHRTRGCRGARRRYPATRVNGPTPHATDSPSCPVGSATSSRPRTAPCCPRERERVDLSRRASPRSRRPGRPPAAPRAYPRTRSARTGGRSTRSSACIPGPTRSPAPLRSVCSSKRNHPGERPAILASARRTVPSSQPWLTGPIG
jgi:hypothetical protein